VQVPTPDDLGARKEVKIRIPAHLHVQLHSVKILTGREIGDVVTEALEVYFDRP
jgi:hypothetical protein